MANPSHVLGICPWVCLNSEEVRNQVVPPIVNLQPPPKKLSYAEMAKDRLERTVDLSSLPIPLMRGNTPVIKIQGKSVERGLNYFKFALVTRNDAMGRNMECIKAGITDLWSDMMAKISPLGRGYLLAKFDKEEDYKKVKFGGPWYYGKQLFRVSDWTPNFNVENQKHSNAGVWIKFPGLSLEYWELDILMAIARTVGNPIHVDRNTLKRDNGYYASVLVDMDLLKKVPDKILVEVEDKGIEFWQEIQIGALPKFCNNCKVVGHVTAGCRFLSVLDKEGFEFVKEVGKISKISIPSKRKEKRVRRKNKGVEQNLEDASEEEGENTVRDGCVQIIESVSDDCTDSECGDLDLMPANEDVILGEKISQNKEHNTDHGRVEMAKIVESEQQTQALPTQKPRDSTNKSANDALEQNMENDVEEENNIENEVEGMANQEAGTIEISSDIELNQGAKTSQGIEEITEGHLQELEVPTTILVRDTEELEQEIGDEEQIAHVVAVSTLQEVPDNSRMNEVLDPPDSVLGMELEDNLVVSDDTEIVPDSQLELVKEANMILDLLNKKPMQDKQGNMSDRRQLVAKISKRKVALLSPGPFKDKCTAAMSPPE